MSELKTGKYQAYPEYKDSGVEWLDEIPSSWQNAPIKYMALSKNSLFLDGNWIESKDISEEGIRYITTGNVGEGTYKEQGIGFVTQETFNKLNCTEVYVGDILISRLNNPIGRACIVPDLDSRVVTSVDNVIFRPDLTYNKRFLVYLFSSKDYFKHTSNLARGATMQRISRGLLGNIRVVFPVKKEQTQIANFLDHETAKIDTLIDKQQQLIKLLKEKRQAVISHAVTKGIPDKEHPNAPMKDSGVEWLGEVPEHWNVLALRRVILSMEQGKSPECESAPALDNQWGVLKTSCVNNGIFHARENKALPSNIQPHKKYEVKAGDILMSRASGSIKLIGSVAIVQTGVRERLLLSDKVFRIHLSTNVLNTYFSYLMATPYMRTLVERAISGAEGMANNITKSSIMEFTGVFPPVNEQISIVEYTSSQCERFDKLIFKAEKGSNLLKERRIALISAAVTGKIDVRNWEQPND